MMEAIEAKKAFVDAVNFLIRRKPAQHTHHAIAEIGIEFVVARQGDDPVLSGQILHLEPGRTHLDPKCFDLGTPRHGAAVVVSE